jgi:hypothetical protein
MPQFERYIGIDYSGAETAASSLPGLRVYAADHTSPPGEVSPPASPRKYWTRHDIAEWLRDELSGPKTSLVGIDHAFSFPLGYFEAHGLPLNWPAFLDDFQRHWPTDEAHTYVDFVRDGVCGEGSKRMGDPSWLRLTELWTPTAKSVFKFDVQGAVAKSTHAGLPWLRYLRTHCRDRVHFWPFDGWEIPPGRWVVAEVYPALWMRRFPNDKKRNADQHAAYATAAWLQRADLNGLLERYFNPALEPEEREIAHIEGWILGVV